MQENEQPLVNNQPAGSSLEHPNSFLTESLLVIHKSSLIPSSYF